MPTPADAARILDDLADLAAVEHALCVRYLWFNAVLGPGRGGQAFGLSLSQMGRIQRTNAPLVKAGRPITLARATELRRDPDPALDLGLPVADGLARFVTDQLAIVRGVDARYRSLRTALGEVGAPDAPFSDPDVHAALIDAADGGTFHEDSFQQLHDDLADRPPSDYVRVTRTEPQDDLERALLRLGDNLYAVVVDAVCTTIAHGDPFDRELRSTAMATMDRLGEIHGFLARSDLLPRFPLLTPPTRPPTRSPAA
jgi:hypothetical protein